mmetsp:Transcript_14654/g.20917  ORF Transcript_14654/g.20917 Transcript_14654/m.20917 type:complete len:422 (+) Transcript_14654:165-1430(+)|eukprot:CAMPEP_0184869412 /NCGR_PEP_ID=MMETSP0580-20130426/33943_1 /TAXON_ID=1118495 /ORGANISM="Dactyliosolen fragilissimus" /LENGTH=421 /DNA_ID=CAMNT_0027370877 /DNA_START=30 /DNA_END=1295 /DNA_ORIENTATION=-
MLSTGMKIYTKLTLILYSATAFTANPFVSHPHREYRPIVDGSGLSRTYGDTHLSLKKESLLASSQSNSIATETDFTAVFDFVSSENSKSKSIESFERIDDAIMGGISTSAVRDPGSNNLYASWSGVCRTDGGGFCGMRTLPFQTPLEVPSVGDSSNSGIFVDCYLASDDEPERRIWKVTLRTDPSRGEMVYQAVLPLPSKESESQIPKSGEFFRLKVPFSSFKLVRGPRLVPDGPPLDISGGIYQIGLTMSKFAMGSITTELDNFRPGFFDLHLGQIGFFKDLKNVSDVKNAEGAAIPNTLTKKEIEKKRPLPLKVLLSVARLLFSEKANRRKSAMKILTSKRNMGRLQAMVFGVKCRKSGAGSIVPSIYQTMAIIMVDSLRTVVKYVARLLIFYPLQLIGTITRFIKKSQGKKVVEPLRE